MIDNILWGALIYIVAGGLIWMEMSFQNSVERGATGDNKFMPFKFLKTVAFWAPRMVSNWPSAEWMCK